MRFLFVDRIVQWVPEKSIQGVKHITSDDAYCYPNEQGLTCFMPSLIGETLGQLAAWNVMASNDFTHRPVAGVVSSARLHRSAFVGETLLLESFIDALDDASVQYHSIARVGDEVVFSIEGALGPLLPMQTFIDADVVRRQFAEINRPCAWPIVKAEQTDNRPLSLSNTGSLVSMSFDSLIDCEPGVRLCAEKRITRAAPYFPDHFPNHPVLPLTVLLECKLNLAREFMTLSQFTQTYDVHELRKIKMSVFVHPGDTITTYLTVKHHDKTDLVLLFRSEVEGRRVCVLEMVLKAEDQK